MYYFIDEEAARRAKEANSLSDYRPGSATKEYRRQVDAAAAIAEAQKQKIDPIHHERIDYLLDVYARKLAENMNEANRIDARVPSVLVSGAGNFPTRKKEKQNRARDANMEQWREIQKILDKIRGAGTAGISSDDPAAVQKLKSKLERLQDEQETMKAVNAFYKKNGTLDGCPHIPLDAIEKLKAKMARSYRSKPKPYESFTLTNNGAEIRRVQARIEELSRQAATEYKGWEFNGGHAEINREANRLQLFFNGKPDADTRAALKREGFRWAPSAGAWQRQLNDRVFYAADRLECIHPLSGELPSALQRQVQSGQESVSEASRETEAPEDAQSVTEAETLEEAQDIPDGTPDEAVAEPETESGEITPEMILEGFDNQSVRVVDSPHGDGAVCEIGQHWFYAFGLEGEETTAAEYAANVPRKDMAREIAAALRDFRATPGFEDEYNYYLSFLRESAERAKSRWRFYVIPDAMTWWTNAGTRTPLERYDSFEEANARFEELRVQDYNDEETPQSGGLSYARLTLGIESLDGETAVDILQVRRHETRGENYLVTDFSRMEAVRGDPAVQKILSRTADEIGFDRVFDCEKTPEGYRPLPEAPFETWDNPWFECATAGGIAAKLCAVLRDGGEEIPAEGPARRETVAGMIRDLLTPNENILEWRLTDFMKKPGLSENPRTRAVNLAREIVRYKARHGIGVRARTSNCKKRKPPQR